VADIAHGLARDRHMESPNIYVDCSNVCFKVGKSVHALANFLIKLAQAGLRIVPICDGKVRPKSKQASNNHITDREKKTILVSILKIELRELRSELYTSNDKQAIMSAIKEKEAAYKRAETAAGNAIPVDLNDKLAGELEHRSAHTKNVSRGFVNQVLTAEFQADALLMGRSINGEALIIMSSDADIPIIASDDCLSLKAFTQDGKMELVSTCRATIENVQPLGISLHFRLLDRSTGQVVEWHPLLRRRYVLLVIVHPGFSRIGIAHRPQEGRVHREGRIHRRADHAPQRRITGVAPTPNPTTPTRSDTTLLMMMILLRRLHLHPRNDLILLHLPLLPHALRLGQVGIFDRSLRMKEYGRMLGGDFIRGNRN